MVMNLTTSLDVTAVARLATYEAILLKASTCADDHFCEGFGKADFKVHADLES